MEQLPIYFDAEELTGWSSITRTYSARDIIRFVEQHGRRFLVPTVIRARSVEQHEFNTILSSVVGLREFRCASHITHNRKGDNEPRSRASGASLTALHLGSAALHPDFADLGPLGSCTNLRKLVLNPMDSCAVADISPLTRCPRLTELALVGLQRLEDLSPLAQLISLRVLKVSHCYKSLSDITALGRLVALEDLELIKLFSLTDIEPLANCAALSCLSLAVCYALEHVRPLAALPRLRGLNLAGCWRVKDVSPLARCPSLESLNLSQSGARGDLSGLVNACASLRQLNLRSTKARCEPREGLEVII